MGLVGLGVGGTPGSIGNEQPASYVPSTSCPLHVSEASSGNISEKILNKRETAKDKTSDESKLPQVAASKSPVSVCNPDVPKKGMGSGVRVRLRDKANIKRQCRDFARGREERRSLSPCNIFLRWRV